MAAKPAMGSTGADAFTCALCSETFSCVVTDEEAYASSPLSEGRPIEECAVVCSECHSKVMRWWQDEAPS